MSGYNDFCSESCCRVMICFELTFQAKVDVKSHVPDTNKAGGIENSHSGITLIYLIYLNLYEDKFWLGGRGNLN